MNPPLFALISLAAGVCWLIIIIVWIVSAFGAKRTIKRNYSWWISRLFLLALITYAIEDEKASGGAGAFWRPSFNPALDILGLAFVVIGIAIAIWARLHLASNWGMPMSLKENPELITTGPYTYIRNPIYSGIILAMVGSGWALGEWWFVVALISLVYFVYASIREEKIMMAAFPDTYPAYKARTKMLIPWVL
ncbi:MAG TPA: isoprenylcysteine carboxylmethyltransferase family protein [Candidatus Paceibacterota bacterium]|nr:isoprenylcysteine carboxylmethyltransferase family protein [Candidatus Paceibacterota bacterium]